MEKTLILASTSPRRAKILALGGYRFRTVRPSGGEETAETEPERFVRTLSERKALSVAAEFPEFPVIGADTAVFLDNAVLGKPKDSADAACMLSRLSGREHEVLTGVTVILGEKQITFCEKTKVRFVNIPPELIARYAKSGESLDKAGGYAIQGRGAVFIESITGDFFNVAGLPLCRLSGVLRQEFGVEPFEA